MTSAPFLLSLLATAAVMAGAAPPPPPAAPQANAGAAAPPPSGASERAPVPPPAPAVRQLAPGVELVPGQFVIGKQPDGNSLIFDDGDGVILFDTGRHVEHTERLLAAVAATGLPPKAIVNSHWHLDHVGGNLLVRERYPQVAVYASGAIHEAPSGRSSAARNRHDCAERQQRARRPGLRSLRAQRPELIADDRIVGTHVEPADPPGFGSTSTTTSTRR